MRKLIIIAILLSILLTSCTVTETIKLNNSTNGSISSDIKVEAFFENVLEDFSEFMPASDKGILEGGLDYFSQSLSQSKNTKSVAYVKTEPNHYLLDMEYTDLMGLINELGNKDQTILKVDNNTLSFYVDINNYKDLKEIVPFLADPNLEVFLPEYNIGYTEQDYLEMIVFLLGEEAPEKILDSYITFNIMLPSSVKSVTNCTKVNSREVSYSFRLIDFLLLSKPLSFSVSWQ